MKNKNLKNSNLILNMNSLAKEAMEKITDNQRGTVIVVDDNFYLQGVLSDGDIRRAMLRGATMITPVSKILNMNPVVITGKDSAQEKAEEIFGKEDSIKILPVVGKSNKLIDVIIRNPERRKQL